VRTDVAQDTPLGQLREIVLAEGGELAEAIVADPGHEAFAPMLSAAERCAERAGDYGLMIESILEGYLVHYGCPRLLEPPDENLRLLAGDYLYALGLARLAALGDLPAVRELADVISLSAAAHAGPAPPLELPEAIWAVGALGVAGGSWGEGEEAKQRIRDGLERGPAEALDAAFRRADALGIVQEARHALIAFNGQRLRESDST
jgi:hypothetical protein